VPFFEYRCRKCGHQFETLVMSPSEEVICEACNSKDLERLLSGFAVQGGGTPGSSGCLPGGT
jgi:putative FmdB family regulatory protein